MERKQYERTHREGEGEEGDEEEDIHHKHLPKMPESPQPRSFERETQRGIVKGRLHTSMKADGDGHLGRVAYVERK